MNKRIVAVSILILAVLAAAAFCSCVHRSTETGTAAVDGYVKQVLLDERQILICYDLTNTTNEEYLGDCYIPIEENTVLADGRTLESIKQGEHVIATYTGTLAEVFPAEIDGTVLVQFVE